MTERKTGLFFSRVAISRELMMDKQAYMSFMEYALDDMYHQIGEKIAESMKDGRGYSVQMVADSLHQQTPGDYHERVLTCAILLSNPSDCEVGEFSVNGNVKSWKDYRIRDFNGMTYLERIS